MLYVYIHLPTYINMLLSYVIALKKHDGEDLFI